MYFSRGPFKEGIWRPAPAHDALARPALEIFGGDTTAAIGVSLPPVTPPSPWTPGGGLDDEMREESFEAAGDMAGQTAAVAAASNDGAFKGCPDPATAQSIDTGGGDDDDDVDSVFD